MAPRLLRVAAALAPASALAPAAAHAAAPPRFVTTQALVRVAAGAPAGFLARATDPDGDAVTIAWAFDDGTTAAGERVAKAWTAPGRHTATVTATDATGLAVSRTLHLEVVDGAVLPSQPGAVQIPRPGPSLAAAARVTLAPARLRLAPDARVAVTLVCAPAADCAGRVALGHDGRRLAAAPYAISAGRSATVRLRLPAGRAARLRRRPERAVVVTVAPDGQAAVRAARVLRTA
jgi:PKD domain-containing protein